MACKVVYSVRRLIGYRDPKAKMSLGEGCLQSVEHAVACRYFGFMINFLHANVEAVECNFSANRGLLYQVP
jgi:hypothetical protein